MSAKLTEISCEPLGRGIEETLNDVRDLHKRGLISSVAVAVVYRDGTTSSANSEAPSVNMLVSAVTLLQHRLVRQLGE